MPNPMFNESTMRKASQTWAPPQPGTDYIPPITDGPVTPWRAGVMTVRRHDQRDRRSCSRCCS